jgi:hypothetical protein
MRLRRIEILLEDKQETMVFVTNQLTLAAATISAIYKDRWQVELFFESSTCCTPLDAMKFRGSFVRNPPLVGSLVGSGGLSIARRPLCAESMVRPHMLALPATA